MNRSGRDPFSMQLSRIEKIEESIINVTVFPFVELVRRFYA
jgi:hypothetical protein